MDIEQSNWANRSSIADVSDYFRLGNEALTPLYEELLADTELVSLANEQFGIGRSKGFTRGIFGKPDVDSVDWFGFERILMYVLVRHFRPQVVWETGVFYGGNSLFILRALQKNGSGTLVSAELPATDVPADAKRHPWVRDSEDYDTTALEPGFLVPPVLREIWDLRLGSSLDLIPNFPGPCDLYLHDSDHSMQFLRKELALVGPRMAKGGIVVVDDIDWNNAFFEFAVEGRLHPLMLTDNGKDELRVRTGVAWMGHPLNNDESFT